ncbi:MAG: DUF1697 domain-containing protein [Alphaproteobacteria bacterium]|nr:DUF1697 domain-containing protein [Alphaproteobacteria bacterium]
MARWIALLRGINVGGRNAVPMAALRALCGELGWRGVETFIQSGNVVFDAQGRREALEAALEDALEKRFGFRPAVAIRSAAAWAKLLAANPFAQEAGAEPAKVMIGIAKAPPAKGAAAAIAAKGAAGERVEEAGGALWFHYPEGAGRSKITPAAIDKAAGSPVTARNWRTAVTLGEKTG